MRLRDRYRRLTFWNKLGAWSGLASIAGIPLAILLYWMGQDVTGPSQPIASNGRTIESQLMQAGIRPLPPENRVEILTLLGDSVQLSPRVQQLAPGPWSATTAIFSTEASWASSLYCVEAPPGKRIVAHRVVVLGAMNTKPAPETFFKVKSATPTKICYQVDVKPSQLECPPPAACAVAPPKVEWQLLAELSNSAA